MKKILILLPLLLPAALLAQRRVSTSFETAGIYDSITFVESCCAHSFVKTTHWKYMGNYSVRVEGRNNDPSVATGSKREELNLNSNNDSSARYDWEYARWSIHWPNNDSMTWDRKGKPFMIMQAKQPGRGGVQTGGSPPFSIVVDSNSIQAHIRWATSANPNSNNSSNARIYQVGAFQKGLDYHFLLRYIRTHNTNGITQLWINGRRVLSDTGRNYFEGAGKPSVKFGMYNWLWAGEGYGGSIVTRRVMYLDDIGVFGAASSYNTVATFYPPNEVPPNAVVPQRNENQWTAIVPLVCIIGVGGFLGSAVYKRNKKKGS